MDMGAIRPEHRSVTYSPHHRILANFNLGMPGELRLVTVHVDSGKHKIAWVPAIQDYPGIDMVTVTWWDVMLIQGTLLLPS